MVYNNRFNCNLSGGKRRNKGIQKYGRYHSLAERLRAEAKALQEYLIRCQKGRRNRKKKS